MSRRNRFQPPAVEQGQKIRVPESCDDQTPVWCFRHVKEKQGFDHLEKHGELRPFLSALQDRSQLTWKELNVQRRDALGWEKGDFPPFSAERPAWANGATPLIFRIRNKHGRFIGYRQGRVFSIVWVEADFDLYAH